MITIVYLIIGAFLSFITGYLDIFIVVFTTVSLHEYAHCFMAVHYGIKVKKVKFSIIGQFVQLQPLDHLKQMQKINIILAGPMLNIILWAFCMLFLKGKFEMFRNYNLAVGLFNLLPAIPLDGGRILHIFLANQQGVLMANRRMIGISKIVGMVLMVVGLVQMILYPYNISLFCIGFYILKIVEKEILFMSSDFFKWVLNKYKGQDQNVFEAKTIVVKKETKIKRLISKLRWDGIYLITIIEKNKVLFTVTEMQLVEYISIYGLEGNIHDVAITVIGQGPA